MRRVVRSPWTALRSCKIFHHNPPSAVSLRHCRGLFAAANLRFSGGDCASMVRAIRGSPGASLIGRRGVFGALEGGFSGRNCRGFGDGGVAVVWMRGQTAAAGFPETSACLERRFTLKARGNIKTYTDTFPAPLSSPSILKGFT